MHLCIHPGTRLHYLIIFLGKGWAPELQHPLQQQPQEQQQEEKQVETSTVPFKSTDMPSTATTIPVAKKTENITTVKTTDSTIKTVCQIHTEMSKSSCTLFSSRLQPNPVKIPTQIMTEWTTMLIMRSMWTVKMICIMIKRSAACKNMR